MSIWRQVTRGVRALVHRSTTDREIADEVEHYFELSAAEFARRGLSPADARRAAQLQMGNSTVVREHVRAYGWEQIVETFLGDLRYALRRLRRSPGFTAVAVLTLSLGIGATTAMFSAIKPILLDPLPYRDASRLVALRDNGAGGPRGDVAYGTFREVEARARSF